MAVAGCSANGEITVEDLNGSVPNPIATSEKASGAEFVSGTDQYENSQLRNYKVVSSVGSYYGALGVKTARGYKVYSSVQGAMISKSEVK